MKSSSQPSEYQHFEQALRKILRVSHAEVKAAIETEKTAKRIRRTKRTSSRVRDSAENH
jgi:hypothetical protein